MLDAIGTDVRAEMRTRHALPTALKSGKKIVTEEAIYEGQGPVTGAAIDDTYAEAFGSVYTPKC